jgi:galactosamine-6-phosphate isomerase
MKLHLFDSMDDISNYASDLIVKVIQKKHDLLICTATGNSTTETYRKLTLRKDQFRTGDIRIIKLDEWGGVPMDHPMTCESYLQEKLIKPLKVSFGNYFGFNSNPADPEAECSRIQKILEQEGPIDLCILGLGLNGHIAFNEPDTYLSPHCHHTRLSPSSLAHPMAQDMEVKPGYGMTLGMSDILKSRQILLLISGKGKSAITSDLMRKKISTGLPASFLWLHPDVSCLCDRDAYSLVAPD